MTWRQNDLGANSKSLCAKEPVRRYGVPSLHQKFCKEQKVFQYSLLRALKLDVDF
jgi:hypothetical protein